MVLKRSVSLVLALALATPFAAAQASGNHGSAGKLKELVCSLVPPGSRAAAILGCVPPPPPPPPPPADNF